MRKFLLLFMLLPMLAGAQVKVEINGITYSIIKKVKTAEVSEKSSGKYSGSVNIPESVEYEGVTCSVTSIEPGAFSGCTTLTSVTIGNSVTTIGRNAFWDCYSLKSVTIGNSVTSIKEQAFYNCTRLTSVHISDLEAWCHIQFVGSQSNPLSCAKHLFLNGSEIKDLVIPNSINYIWGSAFSGCSGLTSVTIPNSVTSIASRAFGGCSALTSVTIPNSVTSIGDQAFYGSGGLISLTIGSGVESIGNKAFAECADLEDVICLAKNVPSTTFSSAFEGSYIEYANLHVLPGCKSAYANTTPWYGFGNIVEDAALATLAVGDAQWATFIAPFDVEIPAGVKAYTVDGESNGLLTLTEVSSIKANTPVVLYAEFPINETLSGLSEAENESYTAGLLTGVYSDQEITEGYVLQKQEKVGFYAVSAENPKTVPANHAYIWKAASAEAKALFFDGEATAIEAVEALTAGKAQIYDMNGRKLCGLQKGLNIVNGKKILVK